jgi:hypothetical protein
VGRPPVCEWPLNNYEENNMDNREQSRWPGGEEGSEPGTPSVPEAGDSTELQHDDAPTPEPSWLDRLEALWRTKRANELSTTPPSHPPSRSATGPRPSDDHSATHNGAGARVATDPWLVREG